MRTTPLALVAAIAVAAAALHLASTTPGEAADETVRLTAAGDVGTSSNAAAALDVVKARNPDAHVVLGDLSYNTRPETEWCAFVKVHVGEGFPFELVTGNHEMAGLNGDINDFSACLPNQIPGVVGTYGREYYFDLPKADPLVRVINASAGMAFPEGTWNYAPGDAHHTWMTHAIDSARADGIPFVVVGTHYPCLSIGVYGCAMPSGFFDLMLAKRVDLVLTGHEHAYMRTHQLASGVTGCATLAPGSFDADCVTDSDGVFTSGSGTVFATAGTGGISQRDLNLADPEFDYFAAYAGANRNQTYGVLQLDVTATTLQAGFVRAAGGDFTDSFTIAKPSGNAPPTPLFTASVEGLRVTVNGSNSADDGMIASYDWTFGDGATASGATPLPHDYAASGQYVIRLTVTDDDGATAWTEQTVTATQTPVVVDLQPTADTYVHQWASSTNYGSSASIGVYGTPSVTGFLRFALPAAPPGRVLTAASLRVNTASTASSGTVDTIGIRVGSDAWSESTLTYQNRPAIGTVNIGSWSGLAVGGASPPAALDVAALSGLLGGNLTLNLVGGGSDSAWILSRNNAVSVRPVLSLTFS